MSTETKGSVVSGGDPYAGPASPALPRIDITLDLNLVAVVVTDPQIGFLSDTSPAYEAFCEGIAEQNTIENLQRLFMAAKRAKIPVVISPHYYYPHDRNWDFAVPGQASGLSPSL